MAAEKDSDDKTSVGSIIPPRPKLPTGRPAAPPKADDESDHTQIASAPPPGPKLPLRPPTAAAAPPPADDRTQIAGAAPPMPKLQRPAAGPAAPPADDRTQLAGAAPPAPKLQQRPAAPTAPAADERTQLTAAGQAPADEAEAQTFIGGEEEATVITNQGARPAAAVVTGRLQRLQPAGRSESIALRRSTYLLGRSHTCDVQLYSPSASREHARLSNRGGAWYVASVEGKSVLVNGAAVQGELRLTHQMRVQLGGDELLFIDERVTTDAAPSPGAGNKLLVPVIAVVIALVVAAAIWWFVQK